MRVYNDVICESDHVYLPAVFKEVVNRPSQRFWVSEERAAIVIAAMMRGEKLKGMRPNKQEMFREIYQRAMNLRQQRPELTIFELAFYVVRQAAPKFYLTPGSAKVIICSAKKKWYEERKRKLRHLF